MKSSVIIAAALALCLVAAPAAEALAVTAEGVSAMTPAKKTTKKKTTNKSATRKSTSKKQTTKKQTAKSTSKATKASQTAQPAEQPVVQPAEAQTATPTSSTTRQNATSTTSSTAGSLLGGIISAIGGGTSSSGSGASSAAGDIISSLTTIFNSSKVASKNQLVGTWTYTEPAVVFTSSNVLKSIGGKVASQTIENKLQSQFEKAGIKKGAMKMTFDNDGNFTQTVGSKTMTGTYKVSGKSVTLTYQGGVQQFVGTTQIDGSDLLIVMDASKLLKYANTLGSLTGNTALKTAGSLLSSMDGMEVGLKLNK